MDEFTKHTMFQFDDGNIRFCLNADGSCRLEITAETCEDQTLSIDLVRALADFLGGTQ